MSEIQKQLFNDKNLKIKVLEKQTKSTNNKAK